MSIMLVLPAFVLHCPNQMLAPQNRDSKIASLLYISATVSSANNPRTHGLYRSAAIESSNEIENQSQYCTVSMKLVIVVEYGTGMNGLSLDQILGICGCGTLHAGALQGTEAGCETKVHLYFTRNVSKD